MYVVFINLGHICLSIEFDLQLSFVRVYGMNHVICVVWKSLR